MAVLTRDLQIADKPTLDQILTRVQSIQTGVQNIQSNILDIKHGTAYDFKNCSDNTLRELITASLNGEIDLYEDCGWRVGDKRIVEVNNIAATGVGESHVRQEIAIVLSHHGQRRGVAYTTAAKTKSGANRLYPAFEWDMSECLLETGYMNSSNTNSGSWNSSARKNWMTKFAEALPSFLTMKDFKVITATEYNSTVNKETTGKVSLRAEKEIFGTRSYSNQTEADAIDQVDFYTISANRIKHVAGAPKYYWLRSPYYGHSNRFCYVYDNENALSNDASNTYGLSMFGCIG